MTISTEAADVAGQNEVTDADLLRICQSFNPGQDLDLAKAVRDVVLSKLRAPVADERAAFKKCHSTIIKALAAIAMADGPDTRHEDDPELLYRSPVMDDVVRIRVALDEYSAALASSPVADEQGKPKMPASMRAGDCYPDFKVMPVGTAEIYAEVVEAWARRDERAKASAPVAGEAQRRGKFLPEHVTQQMIWNVQAVLEAECGGLALDERQSRNVMSFLMSEHGPDAAPQARADAGITASHDVATVVAFIFKRFGLPGYAGEVPANVAAAVRRLEAELQPQAGKNDGNLVGHFGTNVTGVMVTSLASLAHRYAMTLSFATRHADCDQLEGIARRVTVKLKDEIRAIISGQSGSSS